MTRYDELVYYHNNGMNAMFIAMLSILFYIVGDLTDDEISNIMSLISMSFDVGSKSLTSGENVYTIYDLIRYVIDNNVYADDPLIDETYMRIDISTAQDYNLITPEQATTLGALL